MLALRQTARQAQRNTSLGDLPLRIVQSEHPDQVGTSFESENDRRAWVAAYRDYWSDLARRSSRGVDPVTLADANHVTMVLHKEPARKLARVVADVVREVREGP